MRSYGCKKRLRRTQTITPSLHGLARVLDIRFTVGYWPLHLKNSSTSMIERFPYSVTNRGLHVRLPLVRVERQHMVCRPRLRKKV